MNTHTFVSESNKIEGILRPPTRAEIAEHDRFIALEIITIAELEHFVSVYQPDAALRNRKGMDVRIGNYFPMRGGTAIKEALGDLLLNMDVSPWKKHIEYERLHPFMDCNGRSGRALWAWMMMRQRGSYYLGFLHHFYYQTLRELR